LSEVRKTPAKKNMPLPMFAGITVIRSVLRWTSFTNFDQSYQEAAAVSSFNSAAKPEL